MLTEDDIVRTTLISGEPELCKAFLFEFAISWAKEGQQVYYFSSKQLESLPLSFHGRSEPSVDVLKLITFVSAPTYEDLASQLVKLHTFERPPLILLVDDLDVFAAHPGVRLCSRELHVARCCALLLNAALTCSKVLGQPVQLCGVSFGGNEYERIYNRYFDNRWSLNPDPGGNDSDGDKKVMMRRTDGTQALEFCKLDDAVLVLRRVYVAKEDDHCECGASSKPEN